METKEIVQVVLATGALVVASVSATLALSTYKFNARTKSAEFLLGLHKAFFAEGGYKAVRDTIDCEPSKPASEIERYIREEPSEFTDFLNFFELVTFLAHDKTLKWKQVEALLGYYLDKLAVNPALRKYIMNEAKGFEHLRTFLRERELRAN